jgi:3-hydroxyisobutyrate dehydrogenase-like beta-hydroxyacid dehydrogenase
LKVGFIGLGRMGAGMAANLVKAGQDGTVFNRTRAKTDELVALGARAAAAVAKACKGEVVITMLANDEVVERVVYGDAIGKQTFVMSQTPSLANLVKLSGNFLIASVIESLGEAMALVGKAGIDRPRYLDLLTSTLFNAPVNKTYGGLIAAEQFEPAGFAAPLGQKDIRLTLAVAEELRVPLPLASLLRDRFLTLMAHGGETLDWSAIGGLAAKDAGEGTN